MSRSDLRLEAYRRLAAAGTSPVPADVDAVQAEWEDRYGPVPEPARALLAVARLRTACVARGITSVVATRGPGLGGPELLARCAPVVLPLSRQTRLARLHGDARYKEGPRQLLLPVGRDDPAGALTHLLEDLVPVAAAAVPADQTDDPA